MKLVSYGKPGAYRAGIWLDNGIADLEQGMRLANLEDPVSDLRLLLSQQNWRDKLERVAKAVDSMELLDPTSTRLGAPIPQPGNVLLAGANTYSHLREAEPLVGKINPPNRPMLIGRSTSSVCGPHDDIVLPPETKKLDYEVEIAAIIGKPCRRITEDQANNHIAGFCVANDLSARDIQIAEHEEVPLFKLTHYLGKSFDTFCPMGPALVTGDEIDWAQPLRMCTTVNDGVRQDSDTSDLIYSISILVSYASSIMTLNPGDVLLTGSPAGVANFMEPPQFLQDGDLVRCQIEQIGAIENRVRREII
ncbi:fumarylacetoacetate hydrolase family protein [Amycolatopsis pithecellobii]|uniref:fumarylacetoacetate hydrolase family protein n=1 Tax=Amycolatopsis pithecellobii TaxID=664692 RepID=UPI0014095DB2|nr:fumarylacetoacetate hydrolase family protein [Amycolatopsis pithecellobii]